MTSLALSFNGEMIQEYAIDKPRFTIGRRPQHDIVIDNIAVSGNHAAIIQSGEQFILEDDGSTNGTRINGNSVERHVLQDGDVIEIGKFHLKFFDGKTLNATSPLLEKTMLVHSPFAGKQLDTDVPPALDAPTQVEPFPSTLSPDLKPHHVETPVLPAADGALPALHYALKVVNGKQAGKEIPLTKPLTTIGKKGVQVVVITRHHNGYFLNHVQGHFPIVNGATINERACPINEQDMLEFCGIKMRVERLAEDLNTNHA